MYLRIPKRLFICYIYLLNFIDKAQNGEIKSVEIQGNISLVRLWMVDFSIYAPRDPNLIETLNDNEVAINAKLSTWRIHCLVYLCLVSNAFLIMYGYSL